MELDAEIEDDDLTDAQEARASQWDQRFRKKVILVSFRNATNVSDATRLRILRDETEAPSHSGVHAPIESTDDLQRKEVRAGLDHFSRHCLASD